MKFDNYESPVQIITKQIQIQQEEQTMKAIQEVGIIVDKDELIRCMQYDRDQYSKGYEQGKEDREDELRIAFQMLCGTEYSWNELLEFIRKD